MEGCQTQSGSLGHSGSRQRQCDEMMIYRKPSYWLLEPHQTTPNRLYSLHPYHTALQATSCNSALQQRQCYNHTPFRLRRWCGELLGKPWSSTYSKPSISIFLTSATSEFTLNGCPLTLHLGSGLLKGKSKRWIPIYDKQPKQDTKGLRKPLTGPLAPASGGLQWALLTVTMLASDFRTPSSLAAFFWCCKIFHHIRTVPIGDHGCWPPPDMEAFKFVSHSILLSAN